MLKTKAYRIEHGSNVKLDKIPTKDDGGLDKQQGEALFAELSDRMAKQQMLLYAQQKHALVIVLQAMDAGGKDSTIRHVFSPINPQGCHVISFKSPNDHELSHDYLWRVHKHTPARGEIAVFNRSHYEDVLIARVKKLVPKSVWSKRFDHINAFEKMLTDEGTVVLKFMLHISKDYQKQRLQRRLDRPEKQWKFNPADIDERQRWDDYQEAFAQTLSRTSFDHAPWYVVPAERRWFRNLLISTVITQAMDKMDLKPPKLTYDPADIVIE